MKTKFSGILALLLVLVVQLSFAQQKTVTGTVNDDQGLPLPGANVLLKGTNTGTQTDFDGNYSISASPGQTIQFTYVGFNPQEVVVGATSRINVNMVLGESLGEVVVVAYGTQSKETVSSAISVIDSEQISQIPIASLDQLFQGQAAGLNVQTSSGQPGDSGTIIIRGRASINGQIEPLFVIDGIPVDEDTFRNINANDIANVSILKDASASALYGNRAAGGVVIVTTKRGKFEQKSELSYRSLYGVSTNTDPNFDVLNAREYLTLQRDNNISNVALGNLSNLSDEEFEQVIADSADTLWEDIFFQQGRTNSQELVWTAGGKNSNSFNSVQYFEQEGITRRSLLQRFSFRSNNEVKLSDKFSVDSQFSASYSKSEFSEDAGSGQLDNPFLVSYLARPEISAFDENGDLDLIGDGSTGFSNLPAIALSSNELDTNDDTELRLIGSLNFKYDFAKNLSAGVRTGIDFRSIRAQRIINPLSLRGQNNNTGAPSQGNGVFLGSHAEQTSIDFTNNTTINLTYENTFGENHNFYAGVFQEYFKRHFETGGFTGFGIDPRLIGSGNGIQDGNTQEDSDPTNDVCGPEPDPVDDPAGFQTWLACTLADLNDDGNPFVANINSTTADLGLLAYFSVVRYDYDNKFGIQANIRRDGTSRFARENRWGTFGAGSAFWNLHKTVLSNSDFINELKLRASWGAVGSQEVTGSALGGLNIPNTLFGLGTGFQQQSSIAVATLGNPDARWERTEQRNIGVDFTLAKNRVSGTIDVYQNITRDLFSDLNVSGISSVFNLPGNFGELENEGVELGLNVNIIENDRFTLSANGNIAYNKNEIRDLNLAEGQETINTGNTALAEGEAFGSFFLVPFEGVNPANGLPLYRDLDGNITDVFSEDDRVFSDRTRDPKYTGGFGLDATYDGFYLNSTFSFAEDQWRNNGSFGVLEGGGNGILAFSNGSASLLRAWQQPGDVTDIPSLAENGTRLQFDDRFLEDASFLRLRNVTIGHRFEAKESSFFSGLNLYVRGTNLITWSKWRGFDPESNLAGTFFEFPTPKTFSFGAEVNF